MKTQTEAARAAKLIRAELKQHFPKIKFSVTSDTYSMGSSVHITWTNGITDKMVREIAGKYQYGDFDGMEDLYHATNIRNDIPQVKWVNHQRNISNNFLTVFFAWARNRYYCLESKISLQDYLENNHSVYCFLTKLLRDKDLTDFDGNFDNLFKIGELQ